MYSGPQFSPAMCAVLCTCVCYSHMYLNLVFKSCLTWEVGQGNSVGDRGMMLKASIQLTLLDKCPVNVSDAETRGLRSQILVSRPAYTHTAQAGVLTAKR